MSIDLENGSVGDISFAKKKALTFEDLSNGKNPYLDTLENSDSDVRDMKAAESKKMSEKDKRTVFILAALNVAVFLFIGIYIFRTGGANEYDIQPQTETVFYDSASVFDGELSVNLNSVDFPDGMQQRFMPLYSENQDTVGWIKIEDTSIDYVVLRAKDNKKYERADFYGEYNRRGSIFMDYRNKIGKNMGSLSKVTILWGHHLTEDMTIFADVEKYMNVEYYKQHPVIEMDTLYANYKWKIFACFSTNVEPSDDNGYVFYYWDAGLSDADTQAFANECVARSWFVNPAVDVLPTDKLLCLSTCTYIFNKYSYHEARCVLMARLVRPGEDAKADVSKAYQNTQPRLPQLYYDINGLPNPFAGAAKWCATS